MRTVSVFVLLLALVGPSLALFCGQDNCYDLLGVKRNVTKTEIRRVFRRLSSELHPDKRPDDAKAAERFRKIGTAYETLTDDAKRAKYDDFLDNPGKYWQYLVQNTKEVYAPKSNVLVVITLLLGIATLLHWLKMNNSYNETINRMKGSPEFKREVTRLVKSKVASTPEEAESMINMDIVGLEKPDWRNLIIFKMLRLPRKLSSYVMWNVKWFVQYKIRKVDYSEEDKFYLIKKNMSTSDEEWAATSDKDKKTFLEEDLWDKEKCDDYLRMKRIALNRLGKGKKKKKHTPVPYSEAEEVSMSD